MLGWPLTISGTLVLMIPVLALRKGLLSVLSELWKCSGVFFIRGKITAGASVFNRDIFLGNWRRYSSSFGFLPSGAQTSQSIYWRWMCLCFLFWWGFFLKFFLITRSFTLHDLVFSIGFLTQIMGHWLHYLYLGCLTNLLGNTRQLQCACIPHFDHLYIYI